MIRPDFTQRIHPEKRIDGFTALDGSVKFFNFVRAILLQTKAKKVLDFGAGRGAALLDDTSSYRRHLRDLRSFGAHVTACDVDEVVRDHPSSDRQVVINPDATLPFDDEYFDVIVSDMTFEHIANPSFVANELTRILRPGGHICARTPNRFGYVKFLTSLVPNKLHASVLKKVQPDRKSFDVFPTVYRMNSVGQIRELLHSCAIMHIHDNADPAYYFGNGLVYRGLLCLHAVLPRGMSTGIYFFIQKPFETTDPADGSISTLRPTQK